MFHAFGGKNSKPQQTEKNPTDEKTNAKCECSASISGHTVACALYSEYYIQWTMLKSLCNRCQNVFASYSGIRHQAYATADELTFESHITACTITKYYAGALMRSCDTACFFISTTAVRSYTALNQLSIDCYCGVCIGIPKHLNYAFLINKCFFLSYLKQLLQ